MKRKETEEGNLQESISKMSRTGENKDNIDKEKKYDRQLRLWGDHGQKELENAKVCLINASSTGVEALKCLILPGIGKFVIVDKQNVKEEDLGNNFFLDIDSLGKPRAECACKLLQELNEDVHGSFLTQDPGELVENDPEFYKEFTIVIASDLNENDLLKLSDLLWRANIPLLICEVRGYIGYIRLVVKEHTVVEAHPDNSHEDLRLDMPFPGLVEYMNIMDLASMDKQDHSHTPYLVIIYKYLEKWKNEHGGCWPKNFKEKTAFREMISQGVMKNDQGVEELEENFDEAVKNVNNVLVNTKIPSHVNEIFNSHRCQHPSEPHLKFWILARAVKEFHSNSGALPLRGSIPDMFSDSARYIQLQNVYKEQATKDIECVHDIVEQCLLDMQLESDFIKIEDTKLFCKNAYFLHAMSGHPLSNELRHSMEGNSHKIGDVIGDNEDSLALLYLLLRSVHIFEEGNKRLPGSQDECLEDDFEKLKAISGELASEYHIAVGVKDDFIREMCRSGAAQLHTTSAIIGGIAAHEVIKVVTKQFIPVNNAFIYNAIDETSLTFEL
ncbi:NEDD8-activating enzyme E1 regulatory subunit-like isoform X4 [Rhopilema esculentum]|uniref:NEDD8-activating enzyme E1 regulatory subunit-like isoform X1 n=1 Tax=Rhopilema esculentum TaxID=499914 RepID=UPI0031D42BC7